MKICYFSCSTIFGGIEKIVIDSLNEISKDHECCLIVPFGCEYKDKLSSNVKIVEYKSYDKRYNIFLYFEVYKIIQNYDIVHTHGAKASQITYILNKFFPFIHIATKHNTRKGKIFNKINKVISVSSEVAKTITHPSDTIYFGIKNKDIEKEKKKIFTIIAIGRLDPIKGFDSLIKEMSKLDFDFQLNIIGEGPQRSNLENLINTLNLNKKVSLLGFKDNIPQYLKNSDLQVISSLTEGLPLTLLEGIMNSSIIISTPVGGIVEVLDKDYLLEINNFSNKINEIHLDYEHSCEDFKIKHKQFKQKFDFNNYSENLRNYYKGCINE